jgi:hypothetical protein
MLLTVYGVYEYRVYELMSIEFMSKERGAGQARNHFKLMNS